MASDWIKTTLDDVCIKITDGAHKSPKSVDSGKPMASVKDLEFYGLNLETARHISEEDYDDLVKQGCKPELGDVLIAKDGNSALDTVCTFEKDAEVVLLSSVAILRPNPAKINSRFLKYYFLSSRTIEYLKRNFISGAAIPRVVLRDFKKAEISLPLMPEQKAIAHILGSLDDKIELNRQMNETLEAMAQALFKSWFVDFDPVIDNALAAGNAIPDEFAERAKQRKAIEKKDNADIQSLFPDEFEFTEEMGWIPKGWGVSKVEEEFDVTMGQSPPGSTYNESGEGIYFFQGSTDFGFRYPTPRIYCTAPKRIAKKRDTLVSVRAPVGDTNIAADDCCIGRGLAALRHKSGSASFTYYSMLQLKENFKIYEGEGTVFGSINQKDFKGLLQLKASDSLVSKFEVKAGALDSKIELNSLNIIKLAKLRDTLLPKLMSGELRIPDAAALVDEAV